MASGELERSSTLGRGGCGRAARPAAGRRICRRQWVEAAGVDAANSRASTDPGMTSPLRQIAVSMSRHPADDDPQGDADEQPHRGALPSAR